MIVSKKMVNIILKWFIWPVLMV